MRADVRKERKRWATISIAQVWKWKLKQKQHWPTKRQSSLVYINEFQGSRQLSYYDKEREQSSIVWWKKETNMKSCVCPDWAFKKQVFEQRAGVKAACRPGKQWYVIRTQYNINICSKHTYITKTSFFKSVVHLNEENSSLNLKYSQEFSWFFKYLYYTNNLPLHLCNSPKSWVKDSWKSRPTEACLYLSVWTKFWEKSKQL